MHKKHYLWFLLLLLPVSVFVVFTIYFLQHPNNTGWLDLSLSTSVSISTIILGVMVYIQSEKHRFSDERKNAIFQQEEQERRDLDLIIRTAPYISFSNIEQAESSIGIIYSISQTSPDCLVYVDSNTDAKSLPADAFTSFYNRGVFFRFIFVCQEERGLNNIVFTSVNIYPRYPNNIRQSAEHVYSFTSSCSESHSNISYLGNDKYQVCKYFMFPTDCMGNSDLARQFEDDLTFRNENAFFNIHYRATNIYDVEINGELKFFSTASIENGLLLFTPPTNVSNWIGNPKKIQSNEVSK